MNRTTVFTRFLSLIGVLWLLPGCYTFKDVSIPPEIKTVKVNYLENKARYINPTLSPQLTDRLRQKIVNQTRLLQTNNDDAHYVISGQITGYDVITTGVSQQQASVNRLNITFHLELRDNVNNKDTESDISRSFDFSANLSLSQAEAQLREDILKNLTDEIFNKIFSNW